MLLRNKTDKKIYISLTISGLTIGLIFFVNPFVDALTGFLVLGGRMSEGALGTPSQIFRMILSIIMLFQLKSTRQLYFYLCIVLSLIIIENFAFIHHLQPMGFVSGCISSYKISFSFLFYFILHKYITNKTLSIDKLIKYFIISALIYSSIVLISNFFGFNYGSYADGVGSKGLFTSANGLGIFIGTASLVNLWQYYSTNKRIYLFGSLVFLYVLLNILSKAALLISIVTISIFLIKLSKSKLLLIIGFFLCISLYYGHYILDFIQDISKILVWKWTYSSSFIDFLISARSQYIEYAISEYSLENTLIYRLFIGGGYFMAYKNPFSEFFLLDGASSFMESELFDMFFMYGLLGCAFYIFFFFKGLKHLRNSQFNNASILRTMWILLYFHSAFAGHVLFNGMSILAFICLYVIIEFQSKKIYDDKKDTQG